MNLRTIKSNVARWLRPTDKVDKTRKIANRLHRNRLVIHRDDADDNWRKAECIRKNPIRRGLFWVNQPFIYIEKRAIEPLAHWVDKADFFRIAERLSPTIEAVGVIGIPLALFFAAQSYEKSTLQQQAVKDYISQLSTILLEIEGDLRGPQNERIRTLTMATTATLFRDANLDSIRKRQVIEFLAQMSLVNREIVYGPQRPGDILVTLNLRGVDLRDVDLSRINLSGVDLSGADLSNADLYGVDLSGANLSEANLSGVNLNYGTLVGANLFNATLRDATLEHASLIGANLAVANLVNTNLSYADLTGANLSVAKLMDSDLTDAKLYLTNISSYYTDPNNPHLTYGLAYRIKRKAWSRYELLEMSPTQSQLESASLCMTTFPVAKSRTVDPNRDCGKFNR